LRKIFLTAFVLILIDQIIKIWIKTNFILGEEIKVFDWFIIHFTENNGMAFGMEFGGYTGKALLSLFRIIVVGLGIKYVMDIAKKKLPNGALISLGLIIGGALGNIIDSSFYGIIFNDSYNNVAVLFPETGGYSSFLHGKVVDMLYLPLLNSHYPQWLPIWGGDHFIFFRPVFNIADAGISVGIVIILIFYRNLFN
jgi:signal peptidase II